MERTLFLAAGFWVSGVGAWAVGAGYFLASAARHPYCRNGRTSSREPLCMMSDDLSSDEDIQSPVAEINLVGPDDGSSLLTESQRRRLRPINPLKRKRRSRKVRLVKRKEENFVPLVRGAKQSLPESIISAYASDSLEAKQGAGQDYWVDPKLMQEEVINEKAQKARVRAFRKKPNSFQNEKLKQEMSAPYKNNIIGLIVLGVGFVAVVFAAFPGLLEYNIDLPFASFPDTL